MKIAVFLGGTSREREVSLKTGEAIYSSLKRQGYDVIKVDVTKENQVSAFTENEYDIAFLALHGINGEDGRVQGLLDLLGKKYTGSNVVSSAVAMNKMLTKELAEEIGATIPKTYKSSSEIDRYPVVIKPRDEGSSVGLYICKDEKDVVEALKNLEGETILIEEYIAGEEVTCGVLDNSAMGIVKIKPLGGTYDYEAKYTKGKSEYECPAILEEEVYKHIMDISEKVHRKLGCSGVTRSDFLVKDGKAYFLEINTCPGMTETSLVPKVAKLKGHDFDSLVKKILTSLQP